MVGPHRCVGSEGSRYGLAAFSGNGPQRCPQALCLPRMRHSSCVSGSSQSFTEGCEEHERQESEYEECEAKRKR